MPGPESINQPFAEAVSYFRNKIRLPTASWTDLWEGQHARAFVVAGAMKDDLLLDFQQAILKAMTSGTRYQDFRKQFDVIVKKHGWSYNGGAGWRSRVIYDTNLRTAYMSGRFKQMDAVSQQRPYWQYKHSHYVANPRPEHVAWSGLVLRHDDAWWKTHYPPNGWGCKCKVYALNKRDLKRLGKDAPDTAPAINTRRVTVGKRGPNPRSVDVPQGIDPGFAYNVGEASVGKQLTQAKWNDWQATKNRGWKPIEKTDWKSYGRPDRLEGRVSMVSGRQMHDKKEIEHYLISAFNGNEKIFDSHGLPIKLNAAFLADHLSKDLARARYLPWLLETIKNPDEIWISFERHEGTGKVRLRARLIKMVNQKNSTKGMTMVLDANKGDMVGLTFIPKSRTRDVNRARFGKLIFYKKSSTPSLHR